MVTDLLKSTPWDNETFDRVPADLFDDSFWDDGKFTRKEAFIDFITSPMMIIKKEAKLFIQEKYQCRYSLVK